MENTKKVTFAVIPSEAGLNCSFILALKIASHKSPHHLASFYTNFGSNNSIAIETHLLEVCKQAETGCYPDHLVPQLMIGLEISGRGLLGGVCMFSLFICIFLYSIYTICTYIKSSQWLYLAEAQFILHSFIHSLATYYYICCAAIPSMKLYIQHMWHSKPVLYQ